MIPFEMRINGGAIPLGGIASVASLPERRRTGATGGLLKHSLAAMRDAGQPLSGLYTPHYSLYRRYGWELASRTISSAFPPKTTKPRMPAPAGSYRRVTEDALPELTAMYDEFTRAAQRRACAPREVVAHAGPAHVARRGQRRRHLVERGRGSARLRHLPDVAPADRRADTRDDAARDGLGGARCGSVRGDSVLPAQPRPLDAHRRAGLSRRAVRGGVRGADALLRTAERMVRHDAARRRRAARRRDAPGAAAGVGEGGEHRDHGRLGAVERGHVAHRSGRGAAHRGAHEHDARSPRCTRERSRRSSTAS